MPGRQATCPPSFLSYAFRPFFLLAGGFAVLGMAHWLLVLAGRPWPVTGNFSTVWHAHEMSLGFAGAVVAGFLLTAVATWTGRPPVQGGWLVLLAVAWLAGRVVMLLTAVLPPWFTAVLDLAFPLLLAGLATREIIGGRSRRNVGVLVLAWLLAGLALLYQAAGLGLVPLGTQAGTQQLAVRLLVQVLVLMVAAIAGRVIPAFTSNWLRARHADRLPRGIPWLERAILPLTALAGIGQALFPDARPTVLLCLLAGLGHTLRLAGWRGLATWPEPLLMVLHVAYAWLAVGFLLVAATGAGAPLPGTAALHALTVGAVGGMILGMMTRVALGHTGRVLTAARSTVVAYVLMGLATLTRVFGPAVEPLASAALQWSGVLWIAAFGFFLWTYAPILLGPRADTGGKVSS